VRRTSGHDRPISCRLEREELREIERERERGGGKTEKEGTLDKKLRSPVRPFISLALQLIEADWAFYGGVKTWDNNDGDELPRCVVDVEPLVSGCKLDATLPVATRINLTRRFASRSKLPAGTFVICEIFAFRARFSLDPQTTSKMQLLRLAGPHCVKREKARVEIERFRWRYYFVG